MSDDPARIKDVLKELGGRMGIKAPAETAALWSRWKDIVGSAVADHASPSSLRDGVLKVRVDSPGWATEMGYMAGEIRSRINAALGSAVVSEVRVWVGSQNENPTQPSSAGGGRGGQPPRPRRPRPDADPLEAFERARGAWLKSTRQVRSGTRSALSDRGENSR